MRWRLRAIWTWGSRRFRGRGRIDLWVPWRRQPETLHGFVRTSPLNFYSPATFGLHRLVWVLYDIFLRQQTSRSACAFSQELPRWGLYPDLCAIYDLTQWEPKLRKTNRNQSRTGFSQESEEYRPRSLTTLMDIAAFHFCKSWLRGLTLPVM